MNYNHKVNQMMDSKGKTHEGGVGYDANFKEILVEFFSLGLLNGNFYTSQEDVLKQARHIFERALRECPELATQAAVFGNSTNSLKLVPTVWLVFLSTLDDKSLFDKAFSRIIKNPKLLYDFMEISRSGAIRKGLGRGMKKRVNAWLSTSLNDFQVSRNKGKLSEIVKVTRPYNTDPEFQKYMRYLAKDELTFPRAVALKETIEALQNGVVNDDVLSKIQTFSLQLEELKHSTGSLTPQDKGKLYGTIYQGLNYTALILNLVALERVFATKTREIKKYRNGKIFDQALVIETDIPQSIIEMVVGKIKDTEAYKRSHMLPFALFNAERMVVTPEFQVALGNLVRKVSEEAFSIDPDIKLMVGVDTSSSMTSNQVTDSLTACDIATMFGSMIKKSHTLTEVYAVAEDIKHVPLTKQDDVFDMAREIAETYVGYSTYFEQLMDKYQGEKYAILITDGEQADDLEACWLKTKKPKGAKLIIWQLVPGAKKISEHHSVVYVYGYSDSILGLIRNIIEDKGGQIDQIEQLVL